MLNVIPSKLSKSKVICSIIGSMMMFSSFVPSAHALTAGDVFSKLGKKQQYSYVAGVVEGLGYARFLRDKPNETGSTCIYNWFYKGGGERWDEIKKWFEKHNEKSAPTVLNAMVRKSCGK